MSMVLEIIGPVISGHGVGKQLGFPTVNVQYSGEERGVFAAYFLVDGEGEEFRAAVNVGCRPSFNDDQVVVEAHLIDLEEFEIEKGAEVKLRLIKKLRDVQKFENLDDLKQQISRDVEKVRELL